MLENAKGIIGDNKELEIAVSALELIGGIFNTKPNDLPFKIINKSVGFTASYAFNLYDVVVLGIEIINELGEGLSKTVANIRASTSDCIDDIKANFLIMETAFEIAKNILEMSQTPLDYPMNLKASAGIIHISFLLFLYKCKESIDSNLKEYSIKAITTFGETVLTISEKIVKYIITEIKKGALELKEIGQDIVDFVVEDISDKWTKLKNLTQAILDKIEVQHGEMKINIYKDIDITIDFLELFCPVLVAGAGIVSPPRPSMSITTQKQSTSYYSKQPINVELADLEELARKLKYFERGIDEKLNAIVKQANQAIQDVARSYDEHYIRATIRTIDKLCNDVKTSNDAICDELYSQSNAVRKAIDQYQQMDYKLAKYVEGN